jgi:hypothetical protein
MPSPTLGPTQTPIQWVPRVPNLGMKRPTCVHGVVLSLNTETILTYLFTHSLHGVGYYLKRRLSLSLSKNILLSLWKPKVHYRVHKSPPLDPIPSQLNPVRPSIPVSLRSSLMLSSHLRLGLSSGILPSGIPTKTLQTPLPSPMHATSPAHLILLDLINLTIFDEECGL